MSKRGGPRSGAGRPRQPSVRDVAIALSRPSAKPSVSSTRPSGEDTRYVPTSYRPSRASARRSAIPAAAVRARGPERTFRYREHPHLSPREADERDWLAKKGCRSLFSIEAQFADILAAQCVNNKTTSNRKELQMPVPDSDIAFLPDGEALQTAIPERGWDPTMSDAFGTLAECGLDSVRHGSPTRVTLGREPGASIGDFLVEDFHPKGTKALGELRGIKRVAR